MQKDNTKIDRKNDMNSIQWRIHEWLLEENRLVSLKDIYNKFKNYYPDYKQEKCTWNNCSARRQITDDLEAIATSQCTYKVLVRSVNGIGYVGEEETEKWLVSELERIVKELKQAKYQMKKANMKNQLRCTFSKMQEFSEIQPFLEGN